MSTGISDERLYQISPLYTSNIAHNKQIITYIRNLTSLALGVCAGIVQLESFNGFLFYFAATAVVSLLIQLLVAGREPGTYFVKPASDVWFSGVIGGLSSFVFMWALFYGLVAA